MKHRSACILISALVALAANRAGAFATNGGSWPSGEIPMQLQLGIVAKPLTDGATSWNTVAESALSEWNAQLTRSQFTVVRDSAAAQSQGNRLNNVFFSSTVYGQDWGAGVLGVTLTQRSGRSTTTEADVLFNSTRLWDSYRGPLRNSLNAAVDFRRVALHEFGHVLGLDHPDQARPAQTVSAVMNSIVSNTETLTADDIAGVKALYDTAAATGAPQIVTPMVSAAVQTSGSFTLNVVATGTPPLTYTWTFQPAGSGPVTAFRLATGPSYTIGAVQPADAGRYTVTVSNAAGTNTSSADLTVTPLATSAETRAANISTRGRVDANASILIAGFYVGGTTAKTVLLRAVGPTLGTAPYNVPGVLGDPVLTLFNSAGQTVAQNDNWSANANAADIQGAATRVGAFALAAGSRDAAMLVALAPGSYTAQVTRNSTTPGIALVEAYDADPTESVARTRRLQNISTRGPVGTGDNVLIAGLVVAGPAPRTFLIRAVGPTLANAPYNLTGVLSDPFLQIYQGETLLHENDDWDTPAAAQPALTAAGQAVGAFDLGDRRNSALLMTLPPGAYTAKVSGFNNATGIALIEIYEMP